MAARARSMVSMMAQLGQQRDRDRSDPACGTRHQDLACARLEPVVLERNHASMAVKPAVPTAMACSVRQPSAAARASRP